MRGTLTVHKKFKRHKIGQKVSILPMSFAPQMYFTHENDPVSMK